MTDISSKRYNLDNFEASFREFLQNNHVPGRSRPAPTEHFNKKLPVRSPAFYGVVYFYLHSRHSDGPKPETADLSTIALLIDFEAVSSYKMYLESNALPVKSVNRRLSTLRKFLHLLYTTELDEGECGEKGGKCGGTSLIVIARNE